MFALHAGIAIENARLHDQVRPPGDRGRARPDQPGLHDSVIQAIYAQTLALDDVPELIGEDPAEAARRVDEAIDALHAVIRDIRNFIFGLRPALLESGSLDVDSRTLPPSYGAMAASTYRFPCPTTLLQRRTFRSRSWPSCWR